MRSHEKKEEQEQEEEEQEVGDQGRWRRGPRVESEVWRPQGDEDDDSSSLDSSSSDMEFFGIFFGIHLLVLLLGLGLLLF